MSKDGWLQWYYKYSRDDVINILLESNYIIGITSIMSYIIHLEYIAIF